MDFAVAYRRIFNTTVAKYETKCKRFPEFQEKSKK
jgi:hypothetical protein